MIRGEGSKEWVEKGPDLKRMDRRKDLPEEGLDGIPKTNLVLEVKEVKDKDRARTKECKPKEKTLWPMLERNK